MSVLPTIVSVMFRVENEMSTIKLLVSGPFGFAGGECVRHYVEGKPVVLPTDEITAAVKEFVREHNNTSQAEERIGGIVVTSTYTDWWWDFNTTGEAKASPGSVEGIVVNAFRKHVTDVFWLGHRCPATSPRVRTPRFESSYIWPEHWKVMRHHAVQAAGFAIIFGVGIEGDVNSRLMERECKRQGVSYDYHALVADTLGHKLTVSDYVRHEPYSKPKGVVAQTKRGDGVVYDDLDLSNI